MTDDDLRSWQTIAHKIMLGGTKSLDPPQAEAVAGGLHELVTEIRRLRSLVRTACSYLKEHDPERAQNLEAGLDWAPQGPTAL